MGLSISVRLLSGSYEAAEVDDRERAEWPPHPARLFCALVAAARGEVDCAALRWLEQQPVPVVRAGPGRQQSRHGTYVVTNAFSAKGGSQTHPGRTNGLRARARAMSVEPVVRFEWPAEADAATIAALDGMARRIPYLGRSTGVAVVEASTAPWSADPDSQLMRFEPCDLLEADMSLRVPYPGFLGELDLQFDAGRSAWETSRYQGYRLAVAREEVALAPADAPSVYEDVLVLRFAGIRPDARLAVRFTEALRHASLAVAGDNAPAMLHGHGADGHPHVAFLALPDVGSAYADGHLLGMAVAIPRASEAERMAVVRAVLGLRRGEAHDVVELGVKDIGKVELLYLPGLVRPWGASSERWRRGSRRWISATPVVLDRYPKRPEGVEAEVLSSLRAVGLPEPVDLSVSIQPLMRGAVTLRPSDLPRRARGRLFRHVAVTFDRVIHGPVLVGAGRYLGIGLLAPMTSDDGDA